MTTQSDRPADELERLITHHEQRVYRTALAILRSRADAEDVTQEVFLRALEKAPAFEDDEHAKAWLLRVAVNLCRSRLRSPWRGRVTPLLESYPAREPEQHALLEEVLRLPPKDGAILHLYYYEGYNVKEIAGLTGRKESTVRSRLARARQKLGTLLKEDENERL